MKRKGLLIGLLMGILTLAACCATGCGAKGSDTDGSMAVEDDMGKAEAKKITADEAHNMMQKDDQLVIVDVRTEEEYTEGHVPGAILIPNETIGDTPPAELAVKNAKILVYCRSGNRSAQAAKKLVDMGYTDVYDFGGITDWTFEIEQGKPMSAMKKEGTLSSFSSYNLSGKSVDETVFADHKLTMVNIWATFCGPCLREMPDLGQLAKDYGDKDVQIVGMVTDVTMNKDGSFNAEDVMKANKIIKETGADYTHLLPTQDLIKAKLGKVNSVPTTFFVDHTGKVVGEEFVGARSYNDWKEIIDAYVEKVEM